jgi:hypothetical protein
LAKVRKSGLRHDDRPEEIRFDLCAKIRHRRVFDGREIAVSPPSLRSLPRTRRHVQREELDLVTVALR